MKKKMGSLLKNSIIKGKFGEIMNAVQEAWERESEKKEKGYLG